MKMKHFGKNINNNMLNDSNKLAKITLSSTHKKTDGWGFILKDSRGMTHSYQYNTGSLVVTDKVAKDLVGNPNLNIKFSNGDIWDGEDLTIKDDIEDIILADSISPPPSEGDVMIPDLPPEVTPEPPKESLMTNKEIWAMSIKQQKKWLKFRDITPARLEKDRVKQISDAQNKGGN